MLRSVKDAAGEIQARLKNGSERRFPVMGLKGAAGVLLLRETALGVTRPIVVVTARAAEAEALAHEAAFFLDESDEADTPGRRVHHLPAWELKPLANLSPGSDTQAAQIAAMFALLRTPAPIVITSVEAMMTRTIPREILNDSIIRVTAGERLDLELLVEALANAGYQRLPQVEEPGDFSVRGGIVDVFSPLYRSPVRLELEDDMVTSIRRFDIASQRSAGELDEATIVRTRLVAPESLKDVRVRDRAAVRAADIGMVRKEAGELAETLEERPALSRRRIADALCLWRAAAIGRRLSAAGHGAVAGRSRTNSRRRGSLRDPSCRRGGDRRGRATILSGAGIDVPVGRGVRARAGGLRRGRDWIAHHRRAAARRMGSADRGQVAAEPAPRFA